MTACTKETIQVADPSAAVVGSAAEKAVGNQGLQWIRDTSGEGNHQCPPDGNRCTRFQGIAGPDKDVIEEVITVMEQGDRNAVMAIFGKYKTELAKYLPSGVIDGVLNGQLNAAVLYNGRTDRYFMVFGDEPDVRVFEFDLR